MFETYNEKMVFIISVEGCCILYIYCITNIINKEFICLKVIFSWLSDLIFRQLSVQRSLHCRNPFRFLSLFRESSSVGATRLGIKSPSKINLADLSVYFAISHSVSIFQWQVAVLLFITRWWQPFVGLPLTCDLDQVVHRYLCSVTYWQGYNTE